MCIQCIFKISSTGTQAHFKSPGRTCKDYNPSSRAIIHSQLELYQDLVHISRRVKKNLEQKDFGSKHKGISVAMTVVVPKLILSMDSRSF